MAHQAWLITSKYFTAGSNMVHKLLLQFWNFSAFEYCNFTRKLHCFDGININSDCLEEIFRCSEFTVIVNSSKVSFLFVHFFWCMIVSLHQELQWVLKFFSNCYNLREVVGGEWLLFQFIPNGMN